ncbi:ATP-binding protein [Arenimonas sp.]|uniref:ATP-binding protein n=1 Tax=Arenimonas sp. TaxID=1872635 RepID=UPI002D1FBAE8|nr:ATP-binding protein [Arenimonas sp.]
MTGAGSSMMGNRSSQFRRRINNGLLALAVVLILATSAVSVWSTNALSNSIDLVNHTYQVKEAISEVRLVSADSETYGLRYLASSRSDYLQLYQQRLQQTDDLLLQLNAMTHDNPVEQASVTRLILLQDQRRARTKTMLALKLDALRSGSNREIEEKIREGKGAEVADGIRSVLAQMTAEEERLFKLRAEQRDVLVKQTNATMLIANSLALVAGVLGFMAIRRAQIDSENALRNELQAAQARRASEEKSAFLANMSHEIRTPMNAIFGFTQLLSESVTAPLERDWVQAIKKSGQLLLSLINDVLDLSKIEAGKLQLSQQPTDLPQLVDETIELFSTQAAGKGIQLDTQIDKDSLVTVVVDAQRLRQVLMNLVSNAVKYTESGRVTVHLTMSPSLDQRFRDLRLTVVDSGVGIAEDELNRIFEPFHQADSPDGKIRQGTGLGLSITRRLVDLMNGCITVDSRLGKGTTVVIDVPHLSISDVPVASPAGGDEMVDFNRLQPLKILVVDDMIWNAEVARGYLRKSHHTVSVASDGIEGVATTRAGRPDVVLMDLRMPRMNGFEARDAIRADPELQKIAIVAVTASSLGDEEQTLRASFDGYIRKPYTPIDLFATLEAIFGATPLADPTEVAHVDLTAAPGNANPALQARWRHLQGEALVDLRRSMRMREIAAFAMELRVLGSELAWPRLVEHAGVLAAAVQRFDVAAVKDLLGELAGWPEELFDGR